MAWAPKRDQRIPDCLRHCRTTCLQVDSTAQLHCTRDRSTNVASCLHMSRQVYLCRGVKKILLGLSVYIRGRFVADFDGQRVVRRHAATLLCLIIFFEMKASVASALAFFPASLMGRSQYFRFGPSVRPTDNSPFRYSHYITNLRYFSPGRHEGHPRFWTAAV